VKRRDTDSCGKWLNDPKHRQMPSAAGGLYATALDMVIFGQMLLQKGAYNGRHLFSSRSVELMTTNQIPGIKAFWKGQDFPEGSWSYGWNMKGNKLDDSGCYRSSLAFCHGGAGGVYLFADPAYDLVAAYFSVDVEHPELGMHCNKDLFANLIVAAVDD
jgi:serine-type D-Ala-D-Ala carboxypeptidase